jgi:pilus assembly protein CpaB
MRFNSLVMLLLAILFGAGGVYVAQQWLALQSQNQVQIVQEEPAPRATIVVAAANIGFGTTLSEQNLREIPWAGNALPEGSYKSIAELNKEGRRVALAAFSPNEPILNWKISGPGARASLSAVVSEGMRAVSIRVNDVVGVAGFILPGDRVDVFFTKTSTSEEDVGPTTDIIIQNVRVLGVNQVADERTSEPVVANVVTVEVNPVDAQKIALAQSVGQLSLSLRAAGSTDQAPPQRVVAQELVSSPSVYVAEFNARKEEQERINQRIAGLETKVTQVATQAESKFADARKMIAEVEQSLRESVGQTGEALKGELASLQQRLQDVARLQNEGDPTARQKLAALEQSLRDAMAAAGTGNTALRRQLEGLQAALARMNARPVAAAAPAKLDVEALQLVNEKLTVGVSRGLKRDTYEVQKDIYTE